MWEKSEEEVEDDTRGHNWEAVFRYTEQGGRFEEGGQQGPTPLLVLV